MSCKSIYYSLFKATCVAFTIFLVSCGTKKKAGSTESNAQNTSLPKPAASSAELIYKNNFYEALRLKTVGDLEGSQKILEWCVTEKPQDDAVLYLLATYAENSRRITKAREYIKKACEIDPKNIWYVEMLARIQIQTDDFQGAEVSYQRLLNHDRYNQEWLFYYSETLIFNRKFSEAIDVISRLISEVGPVPELVNQRNELYLDQKRDEEMLIVMRKLILDYPNMPEYTSMLLAYYARIKQLGQAEMELNKVLTENTNHAAARVTLAELYISLDQSNKALDQLKIAFESHVLSAESSIKVLISVIDNQKVLNPKVLELAQIVVDKYPTNYMSHAILGEVYRQSGKTKIALSAFEKSLELNQNNYDLWIEVVGAQYSIKNYTEALKTAEKALELFPSQPQVYYYAGMSAMHLKSYQEALNQLESGRDYVIRDPVLQAQFDLAKAEVYLAQNNLPKARLHLESADYLAPNDKQIQNNRAYLMAKYKLDLEKALTIIQKINLAGENEPMFLDTYAWVRFARKEYAEALEIIKTAHNASPNSAEINEHYGDILFKLNRVDDAVSFWIKAKELGNESPALANKITSRKLLE